jgi:hypothetical protein
MNPQRACGGNILSYFCAGSALPKLSRIPQLAHLYQLEGQSI